MESMGGKAELDALVKVYLQQLRKQYGSHIKQAANKIYAREYFRQILLEHNQKIPFNTLFFHELQSVYNHFCNFDERRSLEYTMNYLPMISDHSRDALEKGMLCIVNNKGFDQLPAHYHFLMQEHQCTLSDILLQEREAVRLDDQEATKMLAVHEALQLLFKSSEFSEAEPVSTHKFQFTRAHQTLLGHYYLKVMGIDPRKNASISACAALLHGLAREPFTKFNTSEIYKRLADPFGYATPKTVCEDLIYIRQFFKNLKLEKVLEFIDADILKLQSK